MYISLTRQGSKDSYFIDTKSFTLEGDELKGYGMNENYDVVDPKNFIGNMHDLFIYCKNEKETWFKDLFEFLLYWGANDVAPNVDTPEWNEYYKNAWDNISYKIVVVKDDAMYMFKNNLNVFSSIDELTALNSTYNGKNVDLSTIKYYPLKMRFHDHLNKVEIELDQRYASGCYPYDEISTNIYYHPREFAKAIIERMMYYYPDEPNRENPFKSWDERLKYFKDGFEEHMYDVQDGGFLPEEVNDYYANFEETNNPEVKEYVNFPISYDVSINHKKKLITFRSLRYRSLTLYLDFSSEEEFNKGWFSNSKGLGKMYFDTKEQ